MNETLSRGGLKLEAALRLFALEGAVRGARAVDVGASTGGFTEAMLRGGARHVVAVDSGHDQLLPRLRQDARVESLEGADWKTLALTLAPGPFDFFTVDVSFVAARNMLRGLAFRLRDGAQGVVLIKPQFELPEHRLRATKEKAGGGAVDDPALRREALAKVTEKARRLGFAVVAHADSPVAGGTGTIEVLAHLQFQGRPQSMPLLGERRPPPPASARAAARTAAAPSEPRRWFVVSAPGLEEVTAREVSALPGATQVRAVEGGVELTGPPEVGYAANLRLRVATRVLARVGEVRAREFAKLRHGVAALPWEGLVRPGVPIKVSVSASRCRLYHTGAIAETVELAIADRLARRAGRSASAPAPAAEQDPDAEPPATQTVLLRGSEDRFTVSVDSSGERLHRRGWRQENAAAPLRETLAAGLLALCEWDPSLALLDPMCGAGTIPIEACAQALGIAPGLDRRFAFEDWPLHEGAHRSAWEKMRQDAVAAAVQRREQTHAPISGADRNGAAVDSARRNAERAGLADQLRLERRELVDARPTAERGLVLLNPPYGHRLGNRRTLGLLYREIGFVLRTHFRGWRAGVLVADRQMGDAIRLPVAAAYPLSNGGLRVTLLRYEIA